MNGMFLKKAPLNWQTLQRKNGGAHVQLAGEWYYGCAARMGAPLWRKALCRVMREDDNSPVIGWTECDFTTAENGFHGEFSKTLWIPTGGPYRIETALDTKNEREDMLMRGDVVAHLCVGDVFMIAGQSNAAGFGKDTAYDPAHPLVHVMHGDGTWDIAAHPLADTTYAPDLPSAELSVPGTSPYLAFAKMYLAQTKVPVGLVPSARGGSCIARWDEAQDGELAHNFAHLLACCGGACAGILWYQGCSDTTVEKSAQYDEAFCRVIKALRKTAGEATPVFTMQINHAESGETDFCWGAVREAQRRAGQKLSDVYILPTLDAPLCDRIHNSSSGNVMLGERLGRFCAAVLQHKPVQYAPDISEIQAVEKTLVLTFDHVYAELEQFGGACAVSAFAAQDAQGVLGIEEIAVNANQITLFLQRAAGEGALVSYAARADAPRCIVRDTETWLPALGFYRVPVKNRIAPMQNPL